MEMGKKVGSGTFSLLGFSLPVPAPHCRWKWRPCAKDGVAKNPQRLRPSRPNLRNSIWGANPAFPSLPVPQSTLQRPGCSPGHGDGGRSA